MRDSETNKVIQDLVDCHQPGFALERPFYTSPEIFELDVMQVVMPYWQFVGHASRIPSAGDFFLAEIASESIIISRDKNGELHALLNVCRHRGSRVCLDSSGSSWRFVCPYHAWSYGADGRLIAARQMGEDFDKGSFGLKRFAITAVEGLIFVNLSDEPQPFHDVADDTRRYLGPHDLSAARIAERRVWRVRANWKLVMENFRECYHCRPAHPEYCSVMEHGLDDVLDAGKMSDEFLQFAERWYADDAARNRLPPQVARSGSHQHLCGRYPIREGFLTQTREGQPVAPLMGQCEFDGGVTTLSVYPLHYTTASADHATLFRFTPIDVQSTEVELTWLVREGAQPERDYAVDDVTWLWSITTDQDKKIVEDNQAGVNSRFYVPGPYGDQEPDVKQFIAWYLERLGKATC